MPEAHDHHDGRSHQAPPPEGEGPESFRDPGARHLAAALRTSFLLLGVIMVIGVLAFLGMGFRFIRPGEVAIRTVFGRVVGTTPAGLAYNWPSPIGSIDRVRTGERTIDCGDFWMNETRDDQLQRDLRKRQAPPGGLRPGWDGALLTGDRNLLHVRLKCTYAVDRDLLEAPLPAELARAQAQQPDAPVRPLVLAQAPDPEEHPVWRFLRDTSGPGETVGAAMARWIELARREPALLFSQHVTDPNETMRSVLCDAAIRAAAVRTADGLQRTARSAFERDVHQAAQRRLDLLLSGIVIKTVKVDQSTWPLRTLGDYDAANRAISEADTAKNTARGDAISLLNATAGPVAAEKLVGRPVDMIDRAGAEPSTQPAGEEDYNLIGRYNEAVRLGQAEQAARLLERIENVIVSDATKGEARRVLAEARAYRSDVIQTVRARVDHFNKLLPAYRLNPQFALQRWWAETREQILNYPTAEKHYITGGDGKTVLRLSRDPEIVRQVRGAWLVKKQEEQASGQKATKQK